MTSLAYFSPEVSGGIAYTTFRRAVHLKQFFDLKLVLGEPLSSGPLYQLTLDHGLSICPYEDSVFKDQAFEIALAPTTGSKTRAFLNQAKQDNVPLLAVELRDQLPFRKEVQEYLFLHNVADVIFPNSVDCAKDTQSIFPEHDVHALVNGVDILPAKPKHSQNNPPKIVCIANWRFQKNPEQIIAALHILKQRTVGFQATFVGADHVDLPQKIASADLEDCVCYEPFCEDVPGLLQKADIYCLTSYWEGIAKTVLEAMERSVPCVLSDVPGMSEVLEHGEQGYKVPLHDAQALADHLQVLIEDQALRELMGQKARQHVLQNYDLAKICQNYAQLLKDCLGQQPSTKPKKQRARSNLLKELENLKLENFAEHIQSLGQYSSVLFDWHKQHSSQAISPQKLQDLLSNPYLQAKIGDGVH